MGFLERLRDYLERVERAPDGLPSIRVDVAAHRRYLAELHDRIQADTAILPDAARTRSVLQELLQQQRVVGSGIESQELRGKLPALLYELADRITETVAPYASQDAVAELINIALDNAVGHRYARSTGSRGIDEQIAQVAVLARSSVAQRLYRFDWESPQRYAFEVRAVVRSRSHRHALTRAGAVTLGLSGVEAVRWLLALESAQSLGPLDDWRISPELAAELLTEPAREIDIDDLVDRSWRFSWSTIRRLAAMGLVDYDDQDAVPGGIHFGYTVFDRARPLLEEIAERRATPFAVLADALLRDDVASTVDTIRPDAELTLHASAAGSTALQARMVVHEIRNALIPAQVAISRLNRETAEVDPAAFQRHRERLAAGVQRALEFADEMLRVANLGIEPATVFDAVAALRDALAGVASELNGGLRSTLPDHALAIFGPRSRFVLAVTNLLRNAAQAVSGKQATVEISIEQLDRTLAVRVDDNGPGVPVEQRRSIFEPGVTLRPGGSGQGLALVRQVIVGEMAGTASCSDSPLGGARFELAIPMKGASTHE